MSRKEKTEEKTRRAERLEKYLREMTRLYQKRRQKR